MQQYKRHKLCRDCSKAQASDIENIIRKSSTYKWKMKKVANK